MPPKLVQWLSKANAEAKPRTVQRLLMAGGAVVFLVLIPAGLCAAGRAVAPWIPWTLPPALQIGVGVPAALGGLGLALWSVVTFWRQGKGTPVPVAAPRRLVVTGPFRHCRNLMYLGAMMYYLGLASALGSLVFGLGVLALGLAVGALYARLVEEKELRIRFGEDYERYRQETPLFIPRLRRQRAAARSGSPVNESLPPR